MTLSLMLAGRVSGIYAALAWHLCRIGLAFMPYWPDKASTPRHLKNTV